MALVTRPDLSNDRALSRTKDLAGGRILEELDEKAKVIGNLEAALGKRTAELARLDSEVKELDSLNEASSLIIQQFEKERPLAQEDALDSITRKQNTLKLEQRRTAALRQEVHNLPLLQKAKDKELAQFQQQLNHISEVTGWCQGRKPVDSATFEESMQAIRDMEILIKRLEEERKTMGLILRKKETLIETLRNELNRKKELDEQLLATNNAVRVADRDVREVNNEIAERKKEHGRHDMALVATENSRDLVALNHLEEDLRFLQGEVERNTQFTKDQARLIKAQQFRTEQLEARIACVMDAIQALGLEQNVQSILKGAISTLGATNAADITMETVLPPNEQISVELYEALVRNLSEMRNASSMKDILSLEKSATFEALSRKLEIMLQSKRIEQQVFEQERSEQEEQLYELRRQLEDQQVAWMQQLKEPTRRRLQMQRQVAKALTGNLSVPRK